MFAIPVIDGAKRMNHCSFEGNDGNGVPHFSEGQQFGLADSSYTSRSGQPDHRRERRRDQTPSHQRHTDHFAVRPSRSSSPRSHQRWTPRWHEHEAQYGDIIDANNNPRTVTSVDQRTSNERSHDQLVTLALSNGAEPTDHRTGHRDALRSVEPADQGTYNTDAGWRVVAFTPASTLAPQTTLAYRPRAGLREPARHRLPAILERFPPRAQPGSLPRRWRSSEATSTT